MIDPLPLRSNPDLFFEPTNTRGTLGIRLILGNEPT